MVRLRHLWRGNMGIRLHGIGCRNRPFYQIGVVSNTKRIGRFPEEVFGSYDPMPNEHEEKLLAIDLDRLAYWLGQGAIPSRGVNKLLGLAGFLPMHPDIYKEAWTARLKNTGVSKDDAGDSKESGLST